MSNEITIHIPSNRKRLDPNEKVLDIKSVNRNLLAPIHTLYKLNYSELSISILDSIIANLDCSGCTDDAKIYKTHKGFLVIMEILEDLRYAKDLNNNWLEYPFTMMEYLNYNDTIMNILKKFTKNLTNIFNKYNYKKLKEQNDRKNKNQDYNYKEYNDFLLSKGERYTPNFFPAGLNSSQFIYNFVYSNVIPKIRKLKEATKINFTTSNIQKVVPEYDLFSIPVASSSNTTNTVDLSGRVDPSKIVRKAINLPSNTFGVPGSNPYIIKIDPLKNKKNTIMKKAPSSNFKTITRKKIEQYNEPLKKLDINDNNNIKINSKFPELTELKKIELILNLLVDYHLKWCKGNNLGTNFDSDYSDENNNIYEYKINDLNIAKFSDETIEKQSKVCLHIEHLLKDESYNIPNGRSLNDLLDRLKSKKKSPYKIQGVPETSSFKSFEDLYNLIVSWYKQIITGFENLQNSTGISFQDINTTFPSISSSSNSSSSNSSSSNSSSSNSSSSNSSSSFSSNNQNLFEQFRDLFKDESKDDDNISYVYDLIVLNKDDFQTKYEEKLDDGEIDKDELINFFIDNVSSDFKVNNKEKFDDLNLLIKSRTKFKSTPSNALSKEDELRTILGTKEINSPDPKHDVSSNGLAPVQNTPLNISTPNSSSSNNEDCLKSEDFKVEQIKPDGWCMLNAMFQGYKDILKRKNLLDEANKIDQDYIFDAYNKILNLFKKPYIQNFEYGGIKLIKHYIGPDSQSLDQYESGEKLNRIIERLKKYRKNNNVKNDSKFSSLDEFISIHSEFYDKNDKNSGPLIWLYAPLMNILFSIFTGYKVNIYEKLNNKYCLTMLSKGLDLSPLQQSINFEPEIINILFNGFNHYDLLLPVESDVSSPGQSFSGLFMFREFKKLFIEKYKDSDDVELIFDVLTLSHDDFEDKHHFFNNDFIEKSDELYQKYETMYDHRKSKAEDVGQLLMLRLGIDVFYNKFKDISLDPESFTEKLKEILNSKSPQIPRPELSLQVNTVVPVVAGIPQVNTAVPVVTVIPGVTTVNIPVTTGTAIPTVYSNGNITETSRIPREPGLTVLGLSPGPEALGSFGSSDQSSPVMWVTPPELYYYPALTLNPVGYVYPTAEEFRAMGLSPSYIDKAAYAPRPPAGATAPRPPAGATAPRTSKGEVIPYHYTWGTPVKKSDLYYTYIPGVKGQFGWSPGL